MYNTLLSICLILKESHYQPTPSVLIISTIFHPHLYLALQILYSFKIIYWQLRIFEIYPICQTFTDVRSGNIHCFFFDNCLTTQNMVTNVICSSIHLFISLLVRLDRRLNHFTLLRRNKQTGTTVLGHMCGTGQNVV